MSKICLYCTCAEQGLRWKQSFAGAGHLVAFLDTARETMDRLDRQLFDALVVCVSSAEDDSVLISSCRSAQPNILIVVIDGPECRMSAARARELGVSEHLTYQTNCEIVLLHVERALEVARLRAENAYLVDQVLEGESDVSIVGRSPGMEHVRLLVDKVAQTKSNVLLVGESGTGKELVAQAIHQASGVRTLPLIKVNCPGIPAQLFESELFGHMKGAFTSAFESRKGKFELAEGGNLLLDEVSELPLDLQAKLLRVVESRRFTRVGGSAEIDVRARIIAATNRDLSHLVRKGKFREDLFYRLNVFPIALPSLRIRKEDICEIALHMLSHVSRACGLVAKGISKEAMKALEHYHWPGNVRELRNILERALVLNGGGIVDVNHLPWEIQDGGAERSKDDGRFNHSVETFKKKLLLDALSKNGWVKKEAAQELGLSQRALSHYVVRFGLDSYRSKCRPGSGITG
jgi:DNA-binding NtrC family response regulator